MNAANAEGVENELSRNQVGIEVCCLAESWALSRDKLTLRKCVRLFKMTSLDCG